MKVALGMDLFTCSPLVLLRLDFGGILSEWVCLGLLSNLAGPVQHFETAVLDAWRGKVAADLCSREGFRGDPSLDISGSLQLLNSAHEGQGFLEECNGRWCLKWFSAG